jgi:predicted nucleotidyltransferase
MLNEDFLDFIECLNKNKVAYVLVGGYAAIIKGHTRTTGDMDIFVNRSLENAQKIIKAIDDFGFGSIGFTAQDVMDENGFIRMGSEPLRIDILNSIQGVEFDEVYESAEEYEDEGVKMKVIHINHLIKNKIAAGRPKDLADVRALEKIINNKK